MYTRISELINILPEFNRESAMQKSALLAKKFQVFE